jgi:hypothetical protein
MSMATTIDVRMALAEQRLKQQDEELGDVKSDIKDIKRSQRTIMFMLVGSLFTLTTSSLLLLANLVK